MERGVYDGTEWRRHALGEEKIKSLLVDFAEKGWTGATMDQKSEANKGLAGGLMAWALDHPDRAEMFVFEAMGSMGSSSSAWSMFLVGLAALGARMGRKEPIGWTIETRLVEVDSGLEHDFQVYWDMGGGGSPDFPWVEAMHSAAYAAMRVGMPLWEPCGGEKMSAEQFVMGCMPVMEKVKKAVLEEVKWAVLAKAWDVATCGAEIDKVARPGSPRTKSQSL
jgi:hypothetical protein